MSGRPTIEPDPSSRDHAPGPGWGRTNPAWNQSPSRPKRVAGSPAAAQSLPQGPPSDPGAAPLSAVQSPAVSLQQFTLKRNRTAPVALVLIAVTLFTAILYFGTRPDAPGSPTPTTTPTAPRTIPSLPTGGAFASSIRFESDAVAGTFSVNEAHWDGSTLVVDVTVQVDRGSLSYQFLAMDIASGDITEPLPPSRPGDLPEGTVTTGQQQSGTIRVTKERGDTQILLGEVSGRNLTMLAVKG